MNSQKVGVVNISGCVKSIRVKILDLRPSLQIVSQSILDCSEATGEVSSMYSTPKSERAVALVSSLVDGFAMLLVSCLAAKLEVRTS